MSRSQTLPGGSTAEIQGPAHPRPVAIGWEKRLFIRLLKSLGSPPVRITLWDGQEIAAGAETPVATLRFRNRALLLRTLLNPELRFGEAFAAGDINVEGDLVQFLIEVYRRQPMSSGWSDHLPALHHRRRHRNTVAGSRDNIHCHYDLGNDFYKLWLDEKLVYTCAYYADPGMTLEEAQVAKMDHVCSKLRLRPGETVAEAGCGWGSLARHMARHYGVRVRAFNISHEQILYAREAARAEGLADRVEFVEDDYRNICGHYDAFVSVGMLEHVGVDHYRELGEVIDRCLSASGRGFIHTIGRHKPIRFNAWAEKYVFPGAEPPTLRDMMDIFEPYDFCVLDVENLRLHYARTLQAWLDRFEQARDQVAQMFDERFVRAWRLYLAGSVAAFTAGWMQLYQVVFARHSNNDVPLTRRHLYRQAGEGHGAL